MKYYEVVLPLTDNSGVDTKSQREAFESFCLDTFGGFTRAAPQTGAWKDVDGTVYNDASVSYRLAIDEDQWGNPNQDVKRIGNLCLTLFHDQLAIFVAHIGEAGIISR